MFGSNSSALKFAKPRARVMTEREKAKLKDKQWRKVREFVWQRDEGFCRACVSFGKKAHGHEVHHLLYRSHGGKDDARNLILLCRRCHEDAHAKLLLIRWGGKNPARSVTFERIKP